MVEKGEEEFLLGSCKECSEGLGGFKRKGLFAEGVQFQYELLFDLGYLVPGDIVGSQFLSRIAESGA